MDRLGDATITSQRSRAMTFGVHLTLIAMVCGLSGCAEGYGDGGFAGGYGPGYYGADYLGYRGGYDYYNSPSVYHRQQRSQQQQRPFDQLQQQRFHEQHQQRLQQQATPRPAPPPRLAVQPPSPQEGRRQLNQLGFRPN